MAMHLAMAIAGIALAGQALAQAAPQGTAPGALARPGTAVAAPSPATAPPAATSIQAGGANPFDAQRKAWPDRVPPVPPPPPPPPPAVVTDQDLQLYGVVIAGSVKMANVRLGPRFASAATEGRPFSTFREGQALGEFTLAQVHPTHVVLSAPGGQQSIYFTKKTDRAAGTGAPAPVAQGQSPVQGATPVAQTPAGDPATTQAAATAVVPPAGANAGQAAQQQAAATPDAAPAAANSPNAANTVFNSLSEALNAARNNANMQQNQGANPFQVPSAPRQ
ncbi:hypothetical protein [Acidovorax sp. A1169]|uniref:hypothetical protein n=1 Tax=Acidovorax sp. A1169 TaxID=3059524 RepID=UPI002737F16F|nr:hypothetical protein [Acidovorax sp. A1169]MDP4076474.1 hypothetical protein [Acidovorax sp. A1169]